MLPLSAYAGQIIMLKIPIGVEVETDQYCDDFRIGHHTLSAASWGIGCGWEGIFCHLGLKFFAKIIGNTKNFSNFAFGNHDRVFIV